MKVTITRMKLIRILIQRDSDWHPDVEQPRKRKPNPKGQEAGRRFEEEDQAAENDVPQ
jgi:hypothetical protein